MGRELTQKEKAEKQISKAFLSKAYNLATIKASNILKTRYRDSYLAILHREYQKAKEELKTHFEVETYLENPLQVEYLAKRYDREGERAKERRQWRKDHGIKAT